MDTAVDYYSLLERKEIVLSLMLLMFFYSFY